MDSEDPTKACKNTNKELYRRDAKDSLDPDNFYAPSLHVTEDGKIGINVGGTVLVADLEDWHRALTQSKFLADSFQTILSAEFMSPLHEVVIHFKDKVHAACAQELEGAMEVYARKLLHWIQAYRNQ